MLNQPGSSLESLRDAIRLACIPTSTHRIEAGRLNVLLMPRDFVAAHVLDIASGCLDPNDDWAFRRLLELLSMACPELVPLVVSQGITSLNPDIHEAAEDFNDEETVLSIGHEFTDCLASRRPALRSHLNDLR